MPKVLYRVTLTQEERSQLQEISTRGKHGSQKVLNALILLGCDDGEFQEHKQTAARLAEVLPISMKWERFEFIYTPKHGSWLNMAEIELNVLVKQCLSRRRERIGLMSREVNSWQASRNTMGAKINWQFTTANARVKLKRLYPTGIE